MNLLVFILALILIVAGWMAAALLVMLLIGDLHLDYDTAVPVMSWHAAVPVSAPLYLLLCVAGGTAGYRRRG